MAHPRTLHEKQIYLEKKRDSIEKRLGEVTNDRIYRSLQFQLESVNNTLINLRNG